MDLRSFSFPSSIPTAAAAAALPSLPSAAGPLGPAALLYTLPNPAGLGPSLFNGLAGMLKFSVNVGFGRLEVVMIMILIVVEVVIAISEALLDDDDSSRNLLDLIPRHLSNKC